jgi:hypothetical protein
MVRIIPPLLTRIDRQGDRTDLWTAAGLFHRRSGVPPEQRRGYCIPFYYHEGGRVLYTPLYGFRKGTSDAMTYFAAGLAGRYTGAYEGHWLWPLYRNKVQRDTGHYDDYFLLAGRRWRSDRGHGVRFWPFYRYAQETQGRPPFARTEQTTRQVMLVARHETIIQTRTVESGFETETKDTRRLFPLWRREKTERPSAGETTTRTKALLGLYDSRSSISPSTERVRRRLLWKAWDYRRVNGTVEVDVFPFITYDRSPDSREVSFLWRFYRNRRAADGSRALDLLFIPVRR